MSAMCSGRFERFSPLRWRASRSIEYMSPTRSRRLASSASRNVSSSLADRPARFLPGLGLWDGGGMSVPPGTSGGRAGLPLDGLLPLALMPFAGFATGAADLFATGTPAAFPAGVPVDLLAAPPV